MRLPTLFIILPIALATGAAPRHDYRVYLSDKPGSEYSLSQPEAYLSEKAIERRNRQGIAIDSADLPVCTDYLRTLKRQGAEILTASRWHNTALIGLDDTTRLTGIATLPFVRDIRFVGLSGDITETPVNRKRTVVTGSRSTDTPAFPSEQIYGQSYAQLSMLGIPRLHAAGFHGEGMRIAIIDDGFLQADRNPHIDPDRIAGTFDFLSGRFDYDRYDNHGAMILSTFAAVDSTHYIGSAPNADYWLLVSEHLPTEYRSEEDYWTAAIEFADSIGVDIVSSSLGYYTFDDPAMDYTHAQLDGHSAFITRSAQTGAEKGMAVVVSAGNEGDKAWGKITFPGDAADVLSVGAVNGTRVPASFSGRGYSTGRRIKPDVAAWGVATAVLQSDGSDKYVSGTSFATPLVAGGIACLWQSLPRLTAREIIETVRQNSSQYATPDSLVGYGIPDFYTAYATGSGISGTIRQDAPFIIYTEGSTVTIGAIDQPSHITLYTPSGQTAFQTAVPALSPCPLPQMATGIYIVRRQTAEGIQCRKIRIDNPSPLPL